MDTVEPSYIHIWDGCAPEIAEALRAFSNEWGPYSTASRKYSIYGLVDRKIEPAWRAYVARLAQTHKGYAACSLLSWAEARRSGFRALEGHIITIYRNALPWSVEKVSLKSLLSNAGRNRYCLSTADSEFAATLESLRELAVRCRTKQPKKRARHIDSRAMPRCELCGSPTEKEMFRDAPPDADGNRRLSSRFCPAHRSKNADGKQNAAYQRDRRRSGRFNEELKRLTRQTATPSKPRGGTGSKAADLFIQVLAKRRAYYPDQEAELRHEAHNLVAHQITDRKKEIVALRAMGMTQAEIARVLGLKSRRAVSKALKSVSPDYRLDLQR